VAVARATTRRKSNERCASVTVPSGEPLEEIVEGADRAADERSRPRQELALGPVDVRPVRHDQDRIGLERAEIALEQERDLPRVRRPCEQAQRHRPILALGHDGSGRAKRTGRMPPP